ncbi:MAG: GIY-YIG nuclease family protein [Bacteroidia bacterium]
MAETPIYTVYVLFSESAKKHYTGFTSDFAKRFQSHNELGTKGWTKNFRPWKVILKEENHNKAEAQAREKWLKSGVGRTYIKTLIH